MTRRLVLLGWLAVCGAMLGGAPWIDAKAAEPAPSRIVSTSPSITETLFALGLGDRVVGVSHYCRFPPEVRRCRGSGHFYSRMRNGLSPSGLISSSSTRWPESWPSG